MDNQLLVSNWTTRMSKRICAHDPFPVKEEFLQLEHVKEKYCQEFTMAEKKVRKIKLSMKEVWTSHSFKAVITTE